MMAIGARLARAVNRVADRTGRVVADRYHARLLPTPKEVRHALRYVLLNARRHAVKATPRSGAPCGSTRRPPARWFDGWKRGVPDTDEVTRPRLRNGPAVARARTWLLGVGWRRHGLLDPADRAWQPRIPGAAGELEREAARRGGRAAPGPRYRCARLTPAGTRQRHPGATATNTTSTGRSIASASGAQSTICD